MIISKKQLVLLSIVGLLVFGGIFIFIVRQLTRTVPTLSIPAAEQCGDTICDSGEGNVSCAVDCPAVAIRSDQWTQVNGPFGGWITDLEQVGDTLLAGTSYTYNLGGNGLYKIAEDFSWSALGGSTDSIQDVAVDPTDPQEIMIVTTRGLYRTTDGGQTWADIDLAVMQFTAVSMSKANPDLIFVGAVTETGVTVFTSLDNGEQWQAVTPLPEVDWSVQPIWAGISDAQVNFITVIAPHPENDQLLLVGTNSALFASDDQGNSWRRSDATFHRSDILDIATNPETPDEAYVRVGVFEEETCLAVAGMTDQTAAAAIEFERCAGVYKTEDFGQSWMRLPVHYFDPSEGSVVISALDTNTVYAIFSRKIYQSTDRGRSWDEFFWTHDQPFIPNVGIEKLAVQSNGTTVIAGRQGLWSLANDEDQWEDKNKGFIGSEVVDIVRAADGVLYAGTYSQGVFKSVDGGMNWTFASLNLENPYLMLLATHPAEPQTIFATTNGGIYVSHDGAGTWERIAEQAFGNAEILPGIAHFHGIAIDWQNPQRLYVGGGGDQYTPTNGQGISISTDGGITWQQSVAGFETNVHVSKIIIDKNTADIVYATTQGPTEFQDKTDAGQGVYKSVDAGKTWVTINHGLETVETNTIASDPTNPAVLYLGTDDDGLYKSSNGGSDWSKVTSPALPSQYGVGDIVVDPENSQTVFMSTVDYFRLFLSRGLVGDHGVYISRDGGNTWSSFNEGLRHQGVFSLELDATKKILYAGTRGGGVYWRTY